jgi:hypothetical protein
LLFSMHFFSRRSVNVSWKCLEVDLYTSLDRRVSFRTGWNQFVLMNALTQDSILWTQCMWCRCEVG